MIPIIAPTAQVASKYQKILVIATDATVRSQAFSREILKFSCECTVDELPAQALVGYIEDGARDGRVGNECKTLLDNIADRIKESKYEALVLGCTHFSHLSDEFAKRVPNVKIISPANEGALSLCDKLNRENKELCLKRGRTVYIRS